MFIEIKWIKKCIRSIVFLIVPFVVSSQNLVPNPSFEDYETCPYWVTLLALATPWDSPTSTTPDFLHECATHPWVDVPLNAFGYQYAHTGAGYAGAQFHGTPFGNREYFMTPLLEPLQAGHEYEISFWVSLADLFCGTNQFGAYFSKEPPGPPELFGVLSVNPQFSAADTVFITDTLNWVLISGCFVSTGSEDWMTIGNFKYEHETPLDSNCTLSGDSYYYLDDVSLVDLGPAGTFELNLEDHIVSCGPYVIDPDIPNAVYIWEDGSQDSIFTVTESGVYSVTVTTSCIVGIDSVDVIFHGILPVDLGPEEINLCAGESYDISLDPEFNSYIWQDGSTSPTYSITTSGVYAVTLDDGCFISTDEIQVNFLFPPEPFSLSEQTILCPGDQIEFSFDPGIGNFLWHDNSTSSYYSITEPGHYSLTISNMCGTESDSVTIISIPPPVVDLGPDSITLCMGDSLQIILEPEMNLFQWQDGSFNNTYNISSPGMYAVTVTNDCGSDVDSIEVYYFSVPSIDLGPDTIICPGTDSILLDPGNYSGSVFIWQDSTSAQSYLAVQDGIYSVMVANACGFDTDSVLIDFRDSLQLIDLGPDVSLCSGEQLVLTVSASGASVQWQDGSSADTFLVTGAGIYHVTISDQCTLVSDTVIVILENTPPQISLPQQITLCQGNQLLLDAGLSGVSYLWNDGSALPTLSVNTPGTYSLTVSNNCGTDMDTVIVLDGGPAPFVELGNTILLCDGDTISLSPNFKNVDTWLWNDGSVLSSFDVTTSGTVSVQVSNGCGTGYDTLLVSLLPPIPSLDLGTDTSLCPGESLTLTINTPGINILWPDGSSGPAFVVSDPGVVFASITNSCGQSVDTIQIGALPDIPMLNLGPDQSLCPGEVITLSPGISNVEYTWQDGSTNNTYQSTQEEIIILTISNECGTSTDTLEIFESTQGPQVDLGEDIQSCEGETVLIVSNISGVNFLWQDGSTNSDYTTTQSGTYILSVSNNCGTDADTIQVDISGVTPSPDLGSDTTLCEGTSLALISMADAITTIQWQDGSSSPTFVVSSPGIFTLSESNRCGDAADTIHISYLDAPDPFSLGKDTTLCLGESITLTVPSTAFEILWQDGSDQSSITADQAITYSLQLSNDCGSVSDEIEIDFDTRIPLINLDPSIPWCEGDVITLDATQPFVAEYLWSNGSNSPSIQITSPGLYQIDVTTPCTTISQMIDVFPGNDCITSDGIYIPNVFSPNDDNINDVFTVSFGADLEIISMQGSIFDRWGNLVFGSQTIPFTWDGRFGDKTMMPGVYTYRITCTFLLRGTEKIEVLFGDITLVR